MTTSVLPNSPLTVAVCSIGRTDLFRALSLIAADDTSLVAELIVVDNTGGSLDRTAVADAAGSLPVRVLNGVGPASVGRNLALSEARTDVVLFFDDDCLPEPGWVTEMATYMSDEPEVAAGFGRVEPVPLPNWRLGTEVVPLLGENAWGEAETPDGDLWCPAVSAPGWQPGVYTGPPTIPVSVVGSSNNLALRRSLLLPDRPVFLPHLGPGTGPASGEDTELGYALMREGRKVAHVPQAKMVHNSWLSTDRAEQKQKCYLRGNVEALGYHALRGDDHAARLLGAYLGQFRVGNGRGLDEFGDIFAWGYGSLTDGTDGTEGTPTR
ncbi:glycosyltransferase family 2 protein [Streptomyces sp. NPDC051740]|uniref:glycosyltransferase family 2 protein n=1 Tax=Streptomyces sp. NPDC051740 TaxID=3365673 RepID=UPI00379147AA